MERTAPPSDVRDAARRAGQQLIARGERPTYRVRMAADGSWMVEGAEWLAGGSATRGSVLRDAAAAIAAWLEADPTALDVEIAAADTTTMTPQPSDGQVHGG